MVCRNKSHGYYFMIVVGCYLIFADRAVNIIAVKNLHDYSHLNIFFSHGALGFLLTLW